MNYKEKLRQKDEKKQTIQFDKNIIQVIANAKRNNRFELGDISEKTKLVKKPIKKDYGIQGVATVSKKTRYVDSYDISGMSKKCDKQAHSMSFDIDKEYIKKFKCLKRRIKKR